MQFTRQKTVMWLGASLTKEPDTCKKGPHTNPCEKSAASSFAYGIEESCVGPSLWQGKTTISFKLG